MAAVLQAWLRHGAVAGCAVPTTLPCALLATTTLGFALVALCHGLGAPHLPGMCPRGLVPPQGVVTKLSPSLHHGHGAAPARSPVHWFPQQMKPAWRDQPEPPSTQMHPNSWERGGSIGTLASSRHGTGTGCSPGSGGAATSPMAARAHRGQYHRCLYFPSWPCAPRGSLARGW